MIEKKEVREVEVEVIQLFLNKEIGKEYFATRKIILVLYFDLVVQL